MCLMSCLAPSQEMKESLEREAMEKKAPKTKEAPALPPPPPPPPLPPPEVYCHLSWLCCRFWCCCYRGFNVHLARVTFFGMCPVLYAVIRKVLWLLLFFFTAGVHVFLLLVVYSFNFTGVFRFVFGFFCCVFFGGALPYWHVFWWIPENGLTLNNEENKTIIIMKNCFVPDLN